MTYRQIFTEIWFWPSIKFFFSLELTCNSQSHILHTYFVRRDKYKIWQLQVRITKNRVTKCYYRIIAQKTNAGVSKLLNHSYYIILKKRNSYKNFQFLYTNEIWQSVSIKTWHKKKFLGIKFDINKKENEVNTIHNEMSSKWKLMSDKKFNIVLEWVIRHVLKHKQHF